MDIQGFFVLLCKICTNEKVCYPLNLETCPSLSDPNVITYLSEPDLITYLSEPYFITYLSDPTLITYLSPGPGRAIAGIAALGLPH